MIKLEIQLVWLIILNAARKPSIVTTEKYVVLTEQHQ